MLFAFARLGKEAQGTVPLVRLTRFTDGLPEQPAGAAGLVTWSVRGEQGKSGLLAGEPLLHSARAGQSACDLPALQCAVRLSGR